MLLDAFAAKERDHIAKGERLQNLLNHSTTDEEVTAAMALIQDWSIEDLALTSELLTLPRTQGDYVLRHADIGGVLEDMGLDRQFSGSREFERAIVAEVKLQASSEPARPLADNLHDLLAGRRREDAVALLQRASESVAGGGANAAPARPREDGREEVPLTRRSVLAFLKVEGFQELLNAFPGMDKRLADRIRHLAPDSRAPSDAPLHHLLLERTPAQAHDLLRRALQHVAGAEEMQRFQDCLAVGRAAA
ncbi:hypothetical protein [Ramlibacter sp.]|uniref:hypothetical protein n=1 Tax=Ramlibacter sp. TaxID=1917967 RepID=UPI003D0B42F3